MLHPVSVPVSRSDPTDHHLAAGSPRILGPVRGPLVAEIVNVANLSTATLILHRCFRDKISKREISQCLEAYVHGQHHVPPNNKMNLPGFEILSMFIFRNSIQQPVAVGGLRRTLGRGPTDISLLWIGVAPEHQRKGYGMAMLQILEKTAMAEYGAKVISLCTDFDWEGAAPARAMYEKYGFRVESTFPIFWGKEECLQAWYVKKASS